MNTCTWKYCKNIEMYTTECKIELHSEDLEKHQTGDECPFCGKEIYKED